MSMDGFIFCSFAMCCLCEFWRSRRAMALLAHFMLRGEMAATRQAHRHVSWVRATCSAGGLRRQPPGVFDSRFTHWLVDCGSGMRFVDDLDASGGPPRIVNCVPEGT
jgi:hypothetical protein